MLKLTPAQRSDLRAQAHDLAPVVMIGDGGLTPGVMKEIETSLNSHGLIKIRVLGDDRDIRVAHYETICADLGAAEGCESRLSRNDAEGNPTVRLERRSLGGRSPQASQ